jgi:hypothetical protein
MFCRDDLPYFKEREVCERKAAAAARDPASREVHARMAEHYADRVWALEEEAGRRARG